MKVSHSGDNTDWAEVFMRMFPDKRSKILDRAARLIADDQANVNEHETSISQIQAALVVDPKLVIDVLVSVHGDNTSNSDIEKLRQEAEISQARFEGLVNAVQSLRVGLTGIGAIKENADLPGTVEEWRDAIGNVVARESRQLAAKRDHLLEQKRALEKMRSEILGEIKAAQENVPLLKRRIFSPFRGKVAEAAKAVSALSFKYEHIEAPEVSQLVRGEGIFTRLWTPKFADGRALPIECELYTSPEDLRFAPGIDGLQTYLNSVRSVAGLKGWHSHDGGNFAHSDEYVSFINRKAEEFVGKNNVASGEWFRPNGLGVWALPPREIVDGKVEDANGNRVKTSDQNHFDLRNTGAFKGTFNTEYNGSD